MIKHSITKNLILPLSDIVLKRTISKNLKLLQKSQWWTKEQLEDFQNKQLQKLIKHSYHNVPYYNHLFKKLGLTPDDIQCKNDLTKLPVLTKSDIKKNYPDNIVSKNLGKGTFYKAASSGSTGQPLQYLISKEAYSMNVASKIRGWNWMGYRLGDKFAKVSHNPRHSNEKKLQDKLLASTYIDFEDLDNESLLQLIEIIKHEKPKFLRSYSDPLYFIAKLLKDNPITPSPVAIATTGNILSPKVRELIESVFQCKIFDAYSGEGGAAYHECPTHECYHAAVEYAISEFINIEKVNEDLYQGRLITTCLWNYAVPFIRYDTQDILEWNTKKCSCGRSLLHVNRILGRDTDVIVTPKGKKVIVHKFTIYFANVTSVDEFQIIQNTIDKVIFRLKVNGSYNVETERELLKFWNKAIGDGVQIHFEYVDEIPLTATGKRRFVIRNPEIAL